tara:strand:- start:440 stop:622 length:183 start_codon:yes stop_codon:yes gene_type:complete
MDSISIHAVLINSLAAVFILNAYAIVAILLFNKNQMYMGVNITLEHFIGSNNVSTIDSSK